MRNKTFDSHEAAADDNFENTRDYWSGKLAGEWKKGNFPYDRRVQGAPSPGSAVLDFEFPADLCRSLMKAANESPHRLLMVLLAGLQVLIYRYAGHKDIVIGMPIYKQEQESRFLNTFVPIRSEIQDDAAFKDFLLTVRESIFGAVENQNFPMNELLKILKLDQPAPGGGYPLFDTAILLENIQDKKYIEHIPLSMLFIFRSIDDRVGGTVEYNPSLYEEDTVRRVLSLYRHLLENALARPGALLSELDILSPEEKKQVVFDFNDTRRDFPGDKTVHRLFEEQAARTPGKCAVMGEGFANGGERTSRPHDNSMTYDELNRKANRLARLLREKGIGPGQVVGLLTDPAPERYAGILGILKAGGAYLPIDSANPGDRVRSVLEDSRSSFVLTNSRIVKQYSFTALQNLRGDSDRNIRPCVTAVRPQIKDFDSLPLPDRRLIDHKKYSSYIGHAMVKNTISIQATRGCPYKCAYCHKIWPKTHVFRSAESLFKEVKLYYDRGMRKFAFVDDIFNLNIKNSGRFFQMIVDNGLDVEIFFPNGLRGDILTEDYIDLMVRAGTKNIAFALETASPRLQKLIGKNLDLKKFRHNLEYIAAHYPHINLELFTMIGFPTETEEEAMMTFDFMKSIKWLHFPYVFVLKVYPNTDMARLAMDNGVPGELISRSATSAYHDLPETLPFPKAFVLQYQTRFTNEYFLSKERLLHVLPHQAKLCTEEELVMKYNDYLPMKIERFADILAAGWISPGELAGVELKEEDSYPMTHIPESPGANKEAHEVEDDVFRFLLLDLSHFFSHEKETLIHSMVIEPLGLMYLSTYLHREFGGKVRCEIATARVDFDSYEELYALAEQFQPHLIGIRCLSYYREFFHKAAAYLKQRGVAVPIIAGGPYATSDYNFLLQDPNVELVVRGEGERTTAELVGKIIANGKKLPPEEVLEKIPGIAFVREKDKERRKESARDVLLLDRLTERLERYPEENLEPLESSQGPADLLYLISTSGSTGKPKMVMLEHGNLVNLLNFQYSEAYAPVDFSARVLQFASIGFDVSAQEIFSTLLAGGSLYPINDDIKTDIPRLLDFIERNRISILYLPPAYLHLIFSRPEYARKFPGTVKHIIAAGEQLVVSQPLAEYLRENGVYLHNHYGPTETHVVTTLVIEPGQEAEEFPSIGRPIANTRIYILDEQGNPQPIGAAGELVIAGANVGRGYLNRPELTSEKFPTRGIPENQSPVLLEGARAACYKTGDLAAWLPGGVLRFIGRKDKQVKIRGFRIELGEIENHLKEIEPIKESVVIDRQVPGGDKYLCAYLVSGQQVEIAEVKEKLQRRLPDYMMPTYFVQLDKIPLTPNGKIDRRALPLPGIRAGDTYAAPRDETEKKLVDIWADILALRKEEIGIDHSFFDLGGHSLNATVMISEIHKAFDIKTSLGEIFSQSTIRGLTEYIKGAEITMFISIEAVEKKEYYDLSSAQKRLYVQQHMHLESTIYNLPAVMRLEGKLQKERLKDVFARLIDRHESLRTSFHQEEGEPVQKIHDLEDIDFKIEYFSVGARRAVPSGHASGGPLFEKSGAKTFHEGPSGLNKSFDQTFSKVWPPAGTTTWQGIKPEASPAEPGTVNYLIDRFVRPFDLSQSPLLRVGLIETGEDEHIFIVDIHHIAADGIAMGLLVKEFMVLVAGEELFPLRIRYRDFSEWQNRMFRSEDFKKQEAYWLKRFAGPLPVLDFPVDFAEPQPEDSGGSSLFFEIEPALTSKVRQLVSDTESTLFMVLLAVHTILMSKYTGQEDIVVGTGVAGRRHADLENVMGLFINMLALRSRPKKGKTFLEFLAEVKRTALDGFANQDYQYEELVRALDLQGNAAGKSLFETIIQVQNMDIPELKMPGLTLKPYDYELKTSRHPLVIYVTEEGDKINMIMLYATRVFLHETAEKLAERFIEVAKQVIEDREIKIEDIVLSFELEKLETPVLQEDQGDFEF